MISQLLVVLLLGHLRWLGAGSNSMSTQKAIRKMFDPFTPNISIGIYKFPENAYYTLLWFNSNNEAEWVLANTENWAAIVDQFEYIKMGFGYVENVI